MRMPRLPIGWNHKRIHRIYCELELNLRIRPRKRVLNGTTSPRESPSRRRFACLSGNGCKTGSSKASMAALGMSASTKLCSQRSSRHAITSINGRKTTTTTDHTHHWAISRPQNTPRKWLCKNRPHRAKIKPTDSPITRRKDGSQVMPSACSLSA